MNGLVEPENNNNRLDQLEKSMQNLHTATDTLMHHSLVVDFRKFLTNDKVMGFAIGVIVGNTFTDVVKSFVSLLAGIVNFFGILIFSSDHILKWQVIPISGFIQAFLSMLLIAGSVFFFVKLLNNVWARNPEEQFGYNATFVETQKLREAQEETNALLRELISKTK